MKICLLIAQLAILILIGYTRWEMQGLRLLLEANAGVKYSVETPFIIIAGETFDIREVGKR